MSNEQLLKDSFLNSTDAAEIARLVKEFHEALEKITNNLEDNNRIRIDIKTSYEGSCHTEFEIRDDMATDTRLSVRFLLSSKCPESFSQEVGSSMNLTSNR